MQSPDSGPKVNHTLVLSRSSRQATVWQEIFAGLYFCGLAKFGVLRELIFAIRADWFFLLGINFLIFIKYPVRSIGNEYVQ